MDSLLSFAEESHLEFNSTIFWEAHQKPWSFLEELKPSQGEASLLFRRPEPVVAMTLCYIVFVCWLGPRIMRNREPFQLKNTIRFYNLIMVLLAGVIFVKLYQAFETVLSPYECHRSFALDDGSAQKIYQLASFVIMVRSSEYLDTLFFVLRKKQNQVTFLHVFHHAFVPIYAYWLLRTAPTRFNANILFGNSGIHVLMYFYYFLATFQDSSKQAHASSSASRNGLTTNGAPLRGAASLTTTTTTTKPSAMMSLVARLLQYKKYMTQLQILQFIGLALHTFNVMVRDDWCGVPLTYVLANLLLAAFFFSLFMSFYMGAYQPPSKQRAKSD